MTDQPYTEHDLRAQAVIQHAALTDDPEFMSIGEGMEDACVESTSDGDRKTWGELLPYEADDGDAFNQAQRKIHSLVQKAADLSEWAVNLGADGLEPDDCQLKFLAGDKPIIRVHFAFAPELDDDAREAFVTALGEAAARELRLALDEAAS